MRDGAAARFTEMVAIPVESVGRADPALTYPRCVTGRRACPHEDCGGPWGFDEMLSALGDEKHPEHEMYREWIPVGAGVVSPDNAEKRSPPDLGEQQDGPGGVLGVAHRD